MGWSDVFYPVARAALVHGEDAARDVLAALIGALRDEGWDGEDGFDTFGNLSLVRALLMEAGLRNDLDGPGPVRGRLELVVDDELRQWQLTCLICQPGVPFATADDSATDHDNLVDYWFTAHCVSIHGGDGRIEREALIDRAWPWDGPRAGPAGTTPTVTTKES